MINIKKYKDKLLEELFLISDSIFDLEVEMEPCSGTLKEAAFYFVTREDSLQSLVQMKVVDAALIVTYSVLLKKIESNVEENLLKSLAKTWELKEVFLWPMEINDGWFLLGSKRCIFETYLPGQIRNQLNAIMTELSGVVL